MNHSNHWNYKILWSADACNENRNSDQRSSLSGHTFSFRLQSHRLVLLFCWHNVFTLQKVTQSFCPQTYADSRILCDPLRMSSEGQTDGKKEDSCHAIKSLKVWTSADSMQSLVSHPGRSWLSHDTEGHGPPADRSQWAYNQSVWVRGTWLYWVLHM